MTRRKGTYIASLPWNVEGMALAHTKIRGVRRIGQESLGSILIFLDRVFSYRSPGSHTCFTRRKTLQLAVWNFTVQNLEPHLVKAYSNKVSSYNGTCPSAQSGRRMKRAHCCLGRRHHGNHALQPVQALHEHLRPMRRFRLARRSLAVQPCRAASPRGAQCTCYGWKLAARLPPMGAGGCDPCGGLWNLRRYRRPPRKCHSARPQQLRYQRL